MSETLNITPTKPKDSRAERAYKILEGTIESCNSFIALYEAQHKKNNDSPELQDLLRAMLLFSCAGLDSVVKQLVKDTLPTIIENHEGARQQLSTFVERKMKKSDSTDLSFIAQVLTAPQPLAHLSKAMVKDITSGSLQSLEELSRAGACFDIPTKELITDENKLREAFKARNSISHEMDVDFSQNEGHQKKRNYKTMKESAEIVITIASKFITEVDKKL